MKRGYRMSEKYSTNINSIEDSIKKLKKFCDYEDSVVLIDNALIEIQDAIEIVLGNLEALADMQKTADRELENARRINEEHKRENGELRNKVKELERVIDRGWLVYTEKLENQIADLKSLNREKILELKQNSIPKQVIKDKIEEYIEIIKDFEKTDNTGRFKRQNSIDYYKLEALHELLQESEDKEYKKNRRICNKIS